MGSKEEEYIEDLHDNNHLQEEKRHLSEESTELKGEELMSDIHTKLSLN